MRAVCWEGTGKIQVETVPDPVILNPRDAIIKVTTTATCSSDLHIYDGYIPTTQKGDEINPSFIITHRIGLEEAPAMSGRCAPGQRRARAGEGLSRSEL
jgi:D-arabinose 1-dehydrogenase-like Zn-dependent alcohol dehydrogenase